MMRRREAWPSLVIGVGVLLALVAPWPAPQPAHANDAGPGKRTAASMENLKKLGVALLMYAQDYDEQLPSMKDAATVKKLLLPYVRRDESVFVHPETGEPYRPNAGVSLGRLMLGRLMAVRFRDPGRRPRVLERSKDLGDLSQTVAFYEASTAADGTRGVLFLDGRVRIVSAAEWPRVKRISRIPD